MLLPPRIYHDNISRCAFFKVEATWMLSHRPLVLTVRVKWEEDSRGPSTLMPPERVLVLELLKM